VSHRKPAPTLGFRQAAIVAGHSPGIGKGISRNGGLAVALMRPSAGQYPFNNRAGRDSSAALWPQGAADGFLQAEAATLAGLLDRRAGLRQLAPCCLSPQPLDGAGRRHVARRPAWRARNQVCKI
jgi:hypothetical protein